MFPWFLVLFVGPGAIAGGCEQTISLSVGQKSTEFKLPERPPGQPSWIPMSCRWEVYSPSDTQISVSCPNIYQFKDRPCGGYITVFSSSPLVSYSYCRDEKFQYKSVLNKMDITYNLTQESQGDRPFSCYLSVDAPYSKGPPECECGVRNTHRIAGGTNTLVLEYPMMAALVSLKRKSKPICAATIISDFYALTTAQCLVKKSDWTGFGLLVAEHDLSETVESGSTDLYAIKSVKYHDDYNKTGPLQNDIGLVHVENQIFFHQYVSPACLPFHNREQSFVGEKVHILGWGRTGFKNAKSQILQKAELSVMRPDQCNVWFPKITDKQFCTFTANISPCRGDAGGPILWLDPQTSQLKLIGIHSVGRNCSVPSPNIDTRVTSYLDWIEKYAVNATFCKK